MHTRWSRYAFALVVVIATWGTGIVRPVAQLEAQSWQSPRSEHWPFAQVVTGVTVNGGPIVVDFDTVLSVPPELRMPIEDTMMSGRALLPDDDHFTVTALRSSGDWVHVILVPTRVVEAGWEVELKPSEIVELLGQRDPVNGFSAYLRGSPAFSRLQQEVPRDFIDFSANGVALAPASVDYLFPWTSGQEWFKVGVWGGWHEGNALDFQPVVRTNPPVHFAVLAAAAGRLTEICNDGYQSMLRIEHADGNTEYLHLDPGSIRRDLLGQIISRGQFVGLLYNGRQGERIYNGDHYQYWTSCGWGTAVHLHFILPRRDLIIDGYNANTVAASAFATRYRSSNVRIDSGSEGDPDGGSISYGQTRTGTISPAYDSDYYYFNATAGDIVEIRQNKASGSLLDSFVELSGPGGYFAYNDDGGGSLNAFLRRTLPSSGQYRIRARGYGSSTGAYTLSLTQAPSCGGDCEGDPRWIAFGQTLYGTISPNDDRDTYYFSGMAGRIVSIRMNRTGGGLDPYLELWSPYGVRIRTNDDGGGYPNAWLVHTLPSSGVYRIVARSYALASSGTYSIKLDPVSSGNLALYKPVAVSSVEFYGVEGWRATDGNIGTRWSSRFSDPQWIYVDLGWDRTFNQVVLKWETAYARSFGIYVQSTSMCSWCWTNVYWTNYGHGGTNIINFSPRTARYVLMYGVERGTPWGYSLWEFEVYNTGTTTVPEVPPDDPDKPADSAEQVSPLPPTEGDKEVMLSGDGEYGQEETPLASPGDAITVTEQMTGTQSVVAFISSPSELDCWYTPADSLRFDGIGSSEGPTGTLAITGYAWRSDRNGVLGSQSLFTLPVTSLVPGAHTIYFKAQNELGTWSEEVTTTLTVEWPYRVHLPLVLR